MRVYALSSGNRTGACEDQLGWVSVGPALSKRRSTLPLLTAFGSVLRQLRDARQLSTGQVENALKAGGARLGRSTVTQYEKGAVWSPDPVVLSELARLYRSDLAGLIAVLKANRQDSTLSLNQANALCKGASHVGSVAAGLLEDERDAAREALRQMRDLATTIVKIAAGAAHDIARQEERPADGAQPRRRTNH